MRHYLANMISISRIILLIALFFTRHHTGLFLTLYFICGLTDVLDGYIARKTDTQSDLGARLDSVADLLFYSVVTVCLIVWLEQKIFIFLPWVIVIALIRGANLVIAAYRYHSLGFLHTWGNKIAGLLLFTALPLYLLLQQPFVFWPVCLVAALSAVEETTIHLTSKQLDLNRRSILKN